jgi:predicted nucleic acid-binding protein
LILVATSAWVEFLRDTGSAASRRVDELLEGDIATCDPIRMEVLAGARDENHLDQLRRCWAEPPPSQSSLSTTKTRRRCTGPCRHRGETVRKLIDCLIGAIAIRADVPLLHADADFDLLARHTSLRVDRP